MDAINDYAAQHGCRMTLLVDDITITGAAASTGMLYRVTRMLRAASHKVSEKLHKTRTYGTGQIKHITGTIVRDGKIRLPNRRQKDLSDAYANANTGNTRRERRKAAAKLRGHLAEAKNVDATGISAKFTQRSRNRSRKAVPGPIALKKDA